MILVLNSLFFTLRSVFNVDSVSRGTRKPCACLFGLGLVGNVTASIILGTVDVKPSTLRGCLSGNTPGVLLLLTIWFENRRALSVSSPLFSRKLSATSMRVAIVETEVPDLEDHGLMMSEFVIDICESILVKGRPPFHNYELKMCFSM